MKKLLNIRASARRARNFFAYVWPHRATTTALDAYMLFFVFSAAITVRICSRML